jgi:hypothetical protein
MAALRRQRPVSFRHSMPANMPEDEYLNTFENCVDAAKALLWASSFNWQFASFSEWNKEEFERDWRSNDSMLKKGIDQVKLFFSV